MRLFSQTTNSASGPFKSGFKRAFVIIEYGLLLALIIVVITTMVTLLGTHLNAIFGTLAAVLEQPGVVRVAPASSSAISTRVRSPRMFLGDRCHSRCVMSA